MTADLSFFSLKNFQDYLLHKEHSAENLLFWNWYKRYQARFEALPASQQALSPPPARQPPSATAATSASAQAAKTRVRVPQLKIKQVEGADKEATTATTGADFVRSAELTTSDLSGLATIGSNVQPKRREIDIVLGRFIASGAVYELNISPELRAYTLESAAESTHPDVFKPAAQEAYHVLESASLPLFIRYAASNINPPKKKFWFAVGTVDFCIGLLVYFLCIFLRANRGFRVFGIPFTWFGVMQFYSATQDLCFQVYGRSARQLYQWDLETPDEDVTRREQPTNSDKESSIVPGSPRMGTVTSEQRDGTAGSLSTWTPEWEVTSAADTEASIVASVGDLNVTRLEGIRLGRSKIFEKEIPIEDPYVRKVQRARYVRVWVVATAIALVFIVIFLAVPNRA